MNDTTGQAQQGTALLWTDSSISRAGDKAADEYNAPPGEVEVSELVVKYLTIMRNQYEAKIADLTAKLRRAYHENTVLVAALDEEDDADE